MKINNKEYYTSCRYFRTTERCAVDNKKPECEKCGCYVRKQTHLGR